MRSRLFALLIVGIVGAVFLISRIAFFIQLFFEHSGIPVTQQEVKDAFLNKSEAERRQQLIPRIIHQVYHDWSGRGLPADWEDLRQTCINSNQDWKYMLWTEKTSRDFIDEHYPWFLSTYDGYNLPIQRVDAVRYFLLLHYGGIYLDLDNGCRENLTPLLYYPTWITDGGRGALSNNILASRPNHPFWKLLTDSLIPYNYNYIFPYVTISYASGQWFETAIWERYHSQREVYDDPDKQLFRIMMDDRPEGDEWVFFTQARGGTWVNWDNRMFLWIGDHLFLVALIVGAYFVLLWWLAVKISRGCCSNGNGSGEKGKRRIRQLNKSFRRDDFDV